MVFDGGIGVWAYFCVQTPVSSFISFMSCYTGDVYKRRMKQRSGELNISNMSEEAIEENLPDLSRIWRTGSVSDSLKYSTIMPWKLSRLESNTPTILEKEL